PTPPAVVFRTSPAPASGSGPPQDVVRADGSSGMQGAAGGTDVKQAQFEGPGEEFGGFGGRNAADLPPPVESNDRPDPDEEAPPATNRPVPGGPAVPGGEPPLEGPGTTLVPLPGPDGQPLPPLNREAIPALDPTAPGVPSPIQPGTQRITRIVP